MTLQAKRIREWKGLSQQEVADAIGIPIRRYGSWEREERKMNLEDAARIADVLQCSLDELAGREWRSKTYTDERQKQLNDCYEAMNEGGRALLAESAKSISADPARRGE